MRFTCDHEDCVRYWLCDAAGGDQPIPDKVFMVTSKPNQKSIIVLLNYQEFYTKIKTFMNNSRELLCLV